MTASGDSLVANSNLITKVYFPRVLIPGAAVAAGLVDFAISALVFLLMMVLYGVDARWRMLMGCHCWHDHCGGVGLRDVDCCP